ncbi:AMP-binding protein [Arthrobacter monumenti]
MSASIQPGEQPQGSLIPADLLCDRHDPSASAFTIVSADLDATPLTYAWLQDRSEQAAAAFAALGVKPGDRVATLMGKSADLVVVLLGLWRLGAVHVPLFTAFAPPAIKIRLERSGTALVVVDAGQRNKLVDDGLADELGLRLVVAGGDTEPAEGELALNPLLDSHGPGFPAVSRTLADPLVEIFTSGTTGAPKGVVVPVGALVAFEAYLHYGLDVHGDDVFWNAADPGWAYGLYYGILGPLYAGRTSLLLTTGFNADLAWQVLEKFQITNFAAAPTIFRSMRAARPDGVPGLALRVASSAGEPLDAATIDWARGHLGTVIRDHYGQTEMGMCIINGWHEEVRTELKPGSMGKPMPGYTAAALEMESDEVAASGTTGRVAIDVPASPLMWFPGYTSDETKTAERYSADGRWYITGDSGRVDDDGSFFFSARDDDVVIMAGYRIGPFEVESVMSTHPAVGEVAVIGVPDELRGERLEACVVLKDPSLGTPELVTELQRLVKQQYAAHAYPRDVHFVSELPKTPSGKVQRFILRQEYSA